MQERLEAERLLQAQPFAPGVVLRGVEETEGLSGSARLVVDEAGRRFKLRACATLWRAREIERLVRALSSICPAVVARRGRLVLLEALENHRALTREELLARLEELGAMVARAHAAAEAHRLPGHLARVRGRLRSHHQLRRDVATLRREETLTREAFSALASKLEVHERRFGLRVAVELDDLHKGNLMLREEDGDLRFVDEEGVAVRPLGTGLASLVKTADREEHWRAFRGGYASVRDPGWITPEYTEFVVLLDAVRKVANKLRLRASLDAERARKLPGEIGDLERVALSREPLLDWGFHRG